MRDRIEKAVNVLKEHHESNTERMKKKFIKIGVRIIFPNSVR